MTTSKDDLVVSQSDMTDKVAEPPVPVWLKAVREKRYDDIPPLPESDGTFGYSVHTAD